MRHTIKYIISFIFILIVTCSGLLCSAAVITDSLDPDQKAIILQNATGSGFNSLSSGNTYWAIGTYQDYFSDATYIARGNSSNINSITSTSLTLNLPFYLSGFDSMTIEFFLLSNYAASSSPFGTPTVSRVFGSAATSLSITNIGSVNLRDVTIPSNTGGSSTASYFGYLYQVTVTDPIDFLRIQFSSDYVGNSVKQFLYGFAGVYVNGTSEALANIEVQVSQIGSKVDALTTAIQNATSDIGAIVDGQGNLLTAVEDIKDYAESIDDKQDIIIYATQNDQLVIQEYNERLTEIKNEFNEYNSILEQYYNPPDVNNVTNIIDGGMPSEYDPTIVAPVLSAIFDNSIVTIILVAVLALAVMSYVLFGKKG